MSKRAGQNRLYRSIDRWIDVDRKSKARQNRRLIAIFDMKFVDRHCRWSVCKVALARKQYRMYVLYCMFVDIRSSLSVVCYWSFVIFCCCMAVVCRRSVSALVRCCWLLIFVQYVGGRALVVDCLWLLSMTIWIDGAQLWQNRPIILVMCTYWFKVE